MDELDRVCLLLVVSGNLWMDLVWICSTALSLFLQVPYGSDRQFLNILVPSGVRPAPWDNLVSTCFDFYWFDIRSYAYSDFIYHQVISCHWLWLYLIDRLLSGSSGYCYLMIAFPCWFYLIITTIALLFDYFNLHYCVFWLLDHKIRFVWYSH